MVGLVQGGQDPTIGVLLPLKSSRANDVVRSSIQNFLLIDKLIYAAKEEALDWST